MRRLSITFTFCIFIINAYAQNKFEGSWAYPDENNSTRLEVSKNQASYSLDFGQITYYLKPNVKNDTLYLYFLESESGPGWFQAFDKAPKGHPTKNSLFAKCTLSKEGVLQLTYRPQKFIDWVNKTHSFDGSVVPFRTSLYNAKLAYEENKNIMLPPDFKKISFKGIDVRIFVTRESFQSVYEKLKKYCGGEGCTLSEDKNSFNGYYENCILFQVSKDEEGTKINYSNECGSL